MAMPAGIVPGCVMEYVYGYEPPVAVTVVTVAFEP